ncbi:MAG: hypothetical protein ACREPR_06685 [Brasilonema sp.]
MRLNYLTPIPSGASVVTWSKQSRWRFGATAIEQASARRHTLRERQYPITHI